MATPDRTSAVLRQTNVVPVQRLARPRGDATDAGPFRVWVSRPRHGVAVLRASGPLDMASRSHLVDARHRRLLGTAGTVVLDMLEVSFASSSGVAGLLEAVDDVSARGTRVVVVSSPALDRCLRLLELTDRFSYAGAVDDLLGTSSGEQDRAMRLC